MLKINDRLLIAATAAYSYLFYEQNAGINFLIFTCIFIGILLYRDKSLLREKNWLLAAGMCLLSATGILLHSSALAVFANLCGLLLLSAFSFSSKTSAIVSFLFSCYSVITSLVFVLIDIAARSERHDEQTGSESKGYKYFTIFIGVLLCILFFFLYRQSNPLFASNTEWVSFDFISIGWLVFTLSGFFILYGLFYHRTIDVVVELDHQLPLASAPADVEKTARYQSEISAGILLFSFLNIMLLILNAGDINTIWFAGVLPEGISHSDFVHNGVALIIVSILIATGLIMYICRHNLQAFKSSRALKLVIYAWIVQNLLMLVSTASRNQLYIHDYNLTYKRVGVYIWLVLAVIGLVITFIRVRQDRSNWFLIRNNINVWFCFLALSSIINWDVLITRYNLANKPVTDVDFYYLFSMSDSNIPELMKVASGRDFHLINGQLKNYINSSAYFYTSETFRTLMKKKLGHYLVNYKPDWQSWDLTDRRIMKSLSN